MAKLTLKLHVIERDALFKLAEHERRDARAQAELIIRDYLQSRGLLAVVNATPTDAIKTLGARHATAG